MPTFSPVYSGLVTIVMQMRLSHYANEASKSVPFNHLLNKQHFTKMMGAWSLNLFHTAVCEVNHKSYFQVTNNARQEMLEMQKTVELEQIKSEEAVNFASVMYRQNTILKVRENGVYSRVH